MTITTKVKTENNTHSAPEEIVDDPITPIDRPVAKSPRKSIKPSAYTLRYARPSTVREVTTHVTESSKMSSQKAQLPEYSRSTRKSVELTSAKTAYHCPDAANISKSIGKLSRGNMFYPM